MSATTEAPRAEQPEAGGRFAPSPAGPLPDHAGAFNPPPRLPGRPLKQTIGLGLRPFGTSMRSGREMGEVFRVRLVVRDADLIVTSHPDHVASLFKAKPGLVPSMTAESPLRPVLGPNSVLTANGPRHLRQRKLLLPPFHGDAVRRYTDVITEVAEREVDRWPVGRPFSLAPRMQALTLDVILAGVFGIEGTPGPGTIEHDLRETVRRVLAWSTHPAWSLVDLENLGRDEPRGVLKRILAYSDKRLYAVIRDRRARGATGDDVLSLLLQARTEDGAPLSDEELRDELLTLVLAGHETTANSLAWTLERLVRFPAAYDRLRDVARSEDGDPDGYVEATVHEGMRVRPVIPMVGRRVQVPWQLGDFTIAAQTPVALHILLLHHREDVYPEPFQFRPERFVGAKPGTYTWIPFGGGTRRCLGAALAMAEQRVVLRTVARRTDMVAAHPEHFERARMRNVTMIPEKGGRVVMTARRDR
ncbi:cytochrome P450 [Conexibacter sp. SYSU D00693]|uniref:cytochrome P450 n=1 Tax=Conexibacter sp. SYSU D00693 TaxID=2812560 RepID=UPI00196A9693|nr:cytochrome P450 [Conexibacter sp. SYSU D00693]